MEYLWNILFAGAFFTLWNNALITLIPDSYRKFAGKYVNQIKSYFRSNWLISKRVLCIIGWGILEEIVTVVQNLDYVLSF